MEIFLNSGITILRRKEDIINIKRNRFFYDRGQQFQTETEKQTPASMRPLRFRGECSTTDHEL